ncbi:hypothetical protein ACUN0C_11560 [Faunimonas sp. B44]|uniref:hypothetical protein n=1 Tax=Faunimonas sp. B44 TaxID=3461493 RepID=UPI004043C9AB
MTKKTSTRYSTGASSRRPVKSSKEIFQGVAIRLVALQVKNTVKAARDTAGRPVPIVQPSAPA